MKAQAGRGGKGGSQRSITEKGNAAVSAAKSANKSQAGKKSLYNANGQLKERPKKRGR